MASTGAPNSFAPRAVRFPLRFGVGARSCPALGGNGRKLMDASDRDRKKAWKLQQRKLAQDAFQISESLLESLFETVEAQVEDLGCDHTLRFTSSWIAKHEQPEVEILRWLSEHGGSCDCEVLANAADHWEQNR